VSFNQLNSNNCIRPVSRSHSQQHTPASQPNPKNHERLRGTGTRGGGVIPSPAVAKQQRKAPPHGAWFSLISWHPPAFRLRLLLRLASWAPLPSSSRAPLVLPAAAGRGARDPVRASLPPSRPSALGSAYLYRSHCRGLAPFVHPLDARTPGAARHPELRARSFRAPLPRGVFDLRPRRGIGSETYGDGDWSCSAVTCCWTRGPEGPEVDWGFGEALLLLASEGSRRGRGRRGTDSAGRWRPAGWGLRSTRRRTASAPPAASATAALPPPRRCTARRPPPPTAPPTGTTATATASRPRESPPPFLRRLLPLLRFRSELISCCLLPMW